MLNEWNRPICVLKSITCQSLTEKSIETLQFFSNLRFMSHEIRDIEVKSALEMVSQVYRSFEKMKATIYARMFLAQVQIENQHG